MAYDKTLVSAGFALALLTASSTWAAWSAGDRDYAVADAATLAVIDARSGAVKIAVPRQVPVPMATPRAETAPLDSRIADEELLLSRSGKRIIHGQKDGLIRVWDAVTGRLEWQRENSFPVGLLGKDEDRLALLTSQERRNTEFSVRDLRTNQPIFRQSFHLPAKYSPLRVDSSRFAVFTFAQRDLWIWDDANQQLRQLALPARYLIVPPLRLNRDETLLAVSGSNESRRKSGGEILVFDTRTWKLVRTYGNDDQAQPQALGWSNDGRVLLAVHGDREFVQFDVASGRKLHQWHHVAPPHLEGQARPLGGVRLRIDSPEVLAGANALTPDGRRLLFWDRHRQHIAVWDVGVSLAEERPPLCENNLCGREMADPVRLEIAPSGRALMVNRDGKLWRVDIASGTVQPLSVDPARLLAAAQKAIVAELTVDDCPYRPRECAAFVKKLTHKPAPCQGGQPESSGCRERKAALPWLQAACLAGDPNVCNALVGSALNLSEPTLARLAAAVRCHLMDPQGSGGDICRNVQATGPFPGELATLEQRCKADAGQCWIAAAVLGRIPGERQHALAHATRGCERGSRHACLAGGDIAQRAEDGARARAFFEEACASEEDARCVAGAQRASRLATAESLPESAGAAEAPPLCEQLAGGTLAGVQRFEHGEFVGIRVTALSPAEGWPFRVGDLLRDTIQCAAAGGSCADGRYVAELGRLCQINADSLLHDVVVEVVPEGRKSRRLLLRKAP
jgi:hypothetical protein